MHNTPQNTSVNDQDFWNFVFTLLFAGFFLLLLWILFLVHGELPQSIGLFDALLIVLATFRLTRLFVYDKITRFVRNAFLKHEETYTREGVTYLTYIEYAQGPRRTISDLLGCPWCFGVWSALVVSFFYFLTPIAWLPIFILAVAGLGTFVQLGANALGWAAENGKLKAQQSASVKVHDSGSGRC